MLTGTTSETGVVMLQSTGKSTFTMKEPIFAANCYKNKKNHWKIRPPALLSLSLIYSSLIALIKFWWRPESGVACHGEAPEDSNQTADSIQPVVQVSVGWLFAPVSLYSRQCNDTLSDRSKQLLKKKRKKNQAWDDSADGSTLGSYKAGKQRRLRLHDCMCTIQVH